MKLTKIQNPDGTDLWIQYDEEVNDELQAVGYIEDTLERTNRFKEAIVNTVQGYTMTVLDAVKAGVSAHPPDKVSLEFGLEIGGETGVPFVTKGSAQANINVTVEWNLEKDRREK